MIKFEIKKVFSRTSCKIALLMIVVLIGTECFFAFDVTYVDENGKSIEGISAISELRTMQREWSGFLTEERIAEVINKNIEIESLSEAKSDKLVDGEITFSRKQGFMGIRELLNRSYATGFRDYDYYIADSLKPEQAGYFYSNRIKLLTEWLDGEAKNAYSNNEKHYIIEKYKELKTPMYYTYNLGWDQLIYILPSISSILMLVICFFVAGIFSNEFSWKADSIFFSSQYGRNRAVSSKIMAGLAIASTLYFGVTLIFSLIVLGIMGFDGADCAIQTLSVGWKYLFNTTVFQTYIIILAAGFIGCLFFSLITMFVSAKTKSSVIAVIVPFALIFLPSFLSDMKINCLEKILGILPDRLMVMRETLATLNFYEIGENILHSVPMLFIIYGILTVLLPLVIYYVYRRKTVV